MAKNIVKLSLVFVVFIALFSTTNVYARKELPGDVGTREFICGSDGYCCNKQGVCYENKGDPVNQDAAKTTTSDMNDFTCKNEDIRRAVQIVATSLLWIRIVVPVLVVIMSMIKFGKAAISQDDGDMKDAFKDLIRKVIIGAMVIFIPAIIFAVIQNVAGYNDIWADWRVCIDMLR